jgi:uncharacterized membrane protein HdeD (DUF308 family)
MTTTLARNWWVLALRGVVAILFGIIAFIWPGLTLISLVLLFGAYAFLDGIFSIIAAWRGRETNERWWALLLEGILGLAAGVIAFVWPGAAAVGLLYVIAAWAILTGILEIVAAIRLRQEIDNEWLLGLTGVASIIFGLLLAIWPGAGLLTLTWIIGGYAIAFGVLMLLLAFRLRGWTPADRETTQAV